jgi:hypothetical protein
MVPVVPVCIRRMWFAGDACAEALSVRGGEQGHAAPGHSPHQVGYSKFSTGEMRTRFNFCKCGLKIDAAPAPT